MTALDTLSRTPFDEAAAEAFAGRVATILDDGVAGLERHVLPYDPMNLWLVARVAAGDRT